MMEMKMMDIVSTKINKNIMYWTVHKDFIVMKLKMMI